MSRVEVTVCLSVSVIVCVAVCDCVCDCVSDCVLRPAVVGPTAQEVAFVHPERGSAAALTLVEETADRKSVV